MFKKLKEKFENHKRQKELELWKKSIDIKTALIDFIVDYQSINAIVDTPQNIINTAMYLYKKNVKSDNDIKKYHKQLMNFKKGA